MECKHTYRPGRLNGTVRYTAGGGRLTIQPQIVLVRQISKEVWKNKPSDGLDLVESQKNIPNATEPPCWI